MADVFGEFSIAGKVAVVTGAGEGIGQGLAVSLAKAGADVIVAARREEKLRETKALVDGVGRRAETFKLDVTDLSSIRGLREFAVTTFGKVDILVNAAAYTTTQMAWEVTEEDWDRMTDTTLKGLFFCCTIIGSAMREQKYGKIINLSSTFSRSGIPGRAVYSALKAGVSHLTEALATEWAQDGIRVNALAPCATLTPTRAKMFSDPVRHAQLVSRIPLGRVATPEDFEGAIVFLASPASDFVTGHTLFVDGGWVAAS